MKTKSKVVKKKTEQFTTKGAIKYLRKFFNKSTEKESGKLWDILSALRGPDTAKEGIITARFDKEATTAVLRQVFLGGYNYKVSMKATLKTDNADSVTRRTSPAFEGRVGNHFVGHVMRAFEALGLDYYAENTDVKK